MNNNHYSNNKKNSHISNRRSKKKRPKCLKPGYSNKFFVGGIHARVDETNLTDYFSQFGRITKIELIKNKKTGLSKGYAFITCESDRVAELIKGAEEHFLWGRKMDIGIAADKTQSKELKEGLKQRKVFISGIGPEVSDYDLEQFFSQYGAVNKAYAILEPISRVRTTYGYVVYEHKSSAMRAIKQQVVNIGQSMILVAAFKSKYDPSDKKNKLASTPKLSGRQPIYKTRGKQDFNKLRNGMIDRQHEDSDFNPRHVYSQQEQNQIPKYHQTNQMNSPNSKRIDAPISLFSSNRFSQYSDHFLKGIAWERYSLYCANNSIPEGYIMSRSSSDLSKTFLTTNYKINHPVRNYVVEGIEHDRSFLNSSSIRSQ